MCEYVEINRDGIFNCNTVDDKLVRTRVKKSQVWTRLGLTCKLGENTTLFDIFSTVDAYPRLKEFISHYSWCPQLAEFHNSAMEEKTENTELLHIEIAHSMAISKYKEKKYLDFDLDFYGVGPIEESQKHLYLPEDANKMIHYGISYEPIQNIAWLPVKLNEEVVIYDRSDLNNLSENEDKLEYGFSLLEVLHAIYWDISFAGGPAENAELLADLKKTSEGIKNGTIKTVPFEDLFKDLE